MILLVKGKPLGTEGVRQSKIYKYVLGSERVNVMLHGHFRGSVEGAVLSKQEVVDGIC